MGQRYSQYTTALPESELIRFFRREGEETRVEPERGWVAKGSYPSACYVEAGWLTRVHSDDDDRSAITATYVPGDFINLDSLCEDEPLGRICALTSSKVRSVPIPALKTAMVAQPQLALDVVQRVVAETDWLREAVMAITRLDSRDKLVYYFGQIRRR